MKALYAVILFLTPFLFSRSLNRIFESPKVVFLLVGLGCLGLWSAWRCAREGARLPVLKKRACHPVAVALLIFYLSYFAACFYSIAPPLSILGAYERQMGLITFTAFLCSFYLVLLLFDREDVPRLLRLIAIPAVIVTIHATLQAWGIFPLGLEDKYREFFTRVFGTLGHPVYLGVYLSMTLPLVVALCLHLQKKSFPFAWLVLPVMLYALAKTQSRGAMIACACVLFLMILLYLNELHWDRPVTGKRKWLHASVALGGVALLACGLFWFIPGLQARLETVLHFGHSHRAQLFAGSWELIKQNPILGIGPETFRIAFFPFKTLQLTVDFPFANHDRAHNQYLHIWATQGIIGLVAYLTLLALIAKTLLRNLKATNAPAHFRVFAWGLIGWIVGYAVAIFPSFDVLVTLFLFHCLAAMTVLLDSGEDAMESELSRKKAPWWASGTIALASAGFIFLGVQIFLSERYALLGNRAESPDEKIHYYERAMRHMPYETYYDFKLALTLTRRALDSDESAQAKRDDLQQAALILRKGIDYTWHPESHVHLFSTIFLEQKRYALAERIIRGFLKADRFNPNMNRNLIVALGYQNKMQEIIELTSKWKEIYPAEGDNYWYAGLAQESLGNLKQAEKEYRRAIALDPANPDYKEDFERLLRQETLPLKELFKN